MEIKGQENYQVQGTPQPLDKTLKQAYIDALKQHIELLEAKKRDIEKIYIDNMSAFGRGLITGLNFAIEQLYKDINQLKD